LGSWGISPSGVGGRVGKQGYGFTNNLQKMQKIKLIFINLAQKYLN
jgi:hypothetical protein